MAAQPPLRPEIGFCLQTTGTGAPRLAGKWFVNVCTHRMVGMPIAPSGQPVSREHLLGRGAANLQVPLDIGTFRKLKERADGSKVNSVCIDVVFNPFVVKMFMDDEFCGSMTDYRPWVTNLAFNNIEKNMGIKLSRDEVKLVKNTRYKDGTGADGRIPREFVDVVEEEEEPAPAARQPPEVSPEPLIEEISSSGGKKKPAIKKGFLNSSKGSLYGDEGSKEGVLPENAGDPMGWMPKSLRGKSKIIDCNSPEYQEHEKKKEAVNAHNEHVSEFRNMMNGDLGGVQRRQQRDKYSDDMPDGTEPVKKYDVDYSRFDDIPDIEEDKGRAPQDDRDWYYDETGKRCQKQRPAASPSVAPGDAGAGAPKEKTKLKKGFLNDPGTQLYGPEGSEQRAPRDEADVLKEYGHLLGMDTDDPLKKAELERLTQELVDYKEKHDGEKGAKPSGYPASPAKPKATAPSPEYTVEPDADGKSLVLVVEVPGLESMKGVDLDVASKSASLVFPAASNLGALKAALPEAVDPTKTRAKFSKKTQRLNVTMPLA